MFKKSNSIVFAVIFILVGCINSSTNKEKKVTNQSSQVGMDISFEGTEGNTFKEEDKQRINTIIIDSEKKVRALLPLLPKEIKVTVTLIDRNIDIVGGVTGRADAPGVVLIEISHAFPGGIFAAANTALSSTIFHEFHHLVRGWTIEGNKFGAGIPIAAVNEGLATVFSEQYTGVEFDANAYPDNVEKWVEEILVLPTDANYSHWMMGEHPDGRVSIGYRVGRYIIHQAIANSDKDILELSELSPDEILKLAQVK